jgi:hypothetical protein
MARYDQKSYLRPLMLSVLAGGLSALAISGAHAASAPTLHGFCSTAAPCTDNGTNTPTAVNPPDFGFSAGGSSATGDVMIEILVPDNVTLPASYTISGPLVGASTFTASLFSSTPWTSGQLDSYLGVSASPTNPIGAYLPSTLPFQPTADGFFVFTADLGSITLPSNSGASDSDLLTLDKSLFAGSYIVAFIDTGDTKLGATANSGAILETGGGVTHGVPEPATWGLMVVGFGGLGAMLRRRRAFAGLAAA